MYGRDCRHPPPAPTVQLVVNGVGDPTAVTEFHGFSRTIYDLRPRLSRGTPLADLPADLSAAVFAISRDEIRLYRVQPSTPRWSKRAVALAATSVFVRPELGALAVTQPALRAAFLYKFATLTECPPDSLSRGVCVLDDTAVEGALSEFVGGSLQLARIFGDDRHDQP